MAGRCRYERRSRPGPLGGAERPVWQPEPRRFDAYIQAVGGSSCANDFTSRLVAQLGPEGETVDRMLRRNNTDGALFLRGEPDRLCIHQSTGHFMLVEVKAWERPNAALEAVQLLNNVR